MGKFIKAKEVFNDLPDNIKDEIFKLAAGKVVYFPKNQDKMPLDHDQVCIKYANQKRTYEDIAEEYGLSKMRICQIIQEERMQYSEERVKYWKNQGMSLRGIAKLYKKSHETIRL